MAKEGTDTSGYTEYGTEQYDNDYTINTSLADNKAKSWANYWY
jgi:putative N-acetylmannosamine-6-phosphate epimerase